MKSLITISIDSNLLPILKKEKNYSLLINNFLLTYFKDDLKINETKTNIQSDIQARKLKEKYKERLRAGYEEINSIATSNNIIINKGIQIDDFLAIIRKFPIKLELDEFDIQEIWSLYYKNEGQTHN